MPDFSTVITITAGEKTCFDPDTQTMCRHVVTTKFGSKWQCGFFADFSTNNIDRSPYPILDTVRTDPTSALKRLKACVETFKPVKEQER